MGNLHQVLRTLHIAFIKSKRNRIIMKSLSNYVTNGVYENAITFDYIKKRGVDSQLTVSTFSSYHSIPKIAKHLILLINKFVAYRIKGLSKDKVYNGSEIIISSSLSEYKIFDFHHKSVLTLYSSIDKMMQVERNKQIFSIAYKTPSTYSVCRDRSFVVEEMIPHEAVNVENAFAYLCENMNVFIKKQRERNNIYEIDFKSSWFHFKNKFGDSCMLEEGTITIMCFTHGDLWSSNIIYDGSNYYVTDFEHADKRYFLYDFFFFIFTEWHLNKNPLLVDNYFGGNYDRYLYAIFDQVGYSYNPNKRQKYFLIFLVFIMSGRWLEYDAINPLIENFLKLYISSYK